MTTFYKLQGLIAITTKCINNVCKVELIINKDNKFFTHQIINNLTISLQTSLHSDINLSVIKLDQLNCHPSALALKLVDNMSSYTNIKASVKQLTKSLIGSKMAGLKARYSGRTKGTNIAQSSWFIQGKIPLHSFSSDIRYSNITIKSNYGICNIKV